MMEMMQSPLLIALVIGALAVVSTALFMSVRIVGARIQRSEQIEVEVEAPASQIDRSAGG